MMDLKTLNAAVQQIAKEKGISAEQVLGAIETALAAAYKREYRKRTELIRCKFNPKTNELQFWQVKVVTDPTQVRIVEPEIEGIEGGEEKTMKEIETAPVRSHNKDRELTEGESDDGEVLPRYNPDRHIFLEEARVIKPDATLDEELIFPLESHADFGRIAAQTAKQVILQALRDAERTSIREEFTDKEGTIMSGVVQRFEHGNVYIDIGRAMGVMFHNESIPGEHYRVGQRIRFYVLAVQDSMRHPSIVLSRAHPAFIRKLFELEVPEIAEGIVEIKDIAREPGWRSKIAVVSHQEGVDPIGSVVGQRGTRIMAVTNELGNEKIDVIEWSDTMEKYIANSLSPAKVQAVQVFPRREAKVFVNDDQLSLAIGKGGQNVRLAAKLTGWKIDVRSQARPEEVQEGGVAEMPAEETAETPTESLTQSAEQKEQSSEETENKKNNIGI